jgi:hypothetical protein
MIQDLCSICLDPLLDKNTDVKAIYNLPECNHSYHTECIVHWFRGGHSNCPCCGNRGTTDSSSSDEAVYMPYVTLLTQFNHIKKFSRQKDTPKFIIDKLEKIKTLETKNIVTRAELKVMDETTGIFKQIHKDRLKLQRKISYNTHAIFKNKRELVLLNPIKPLIIVTRKVIIP